MNQELQKDLIERLVKETIDGSRTWELFEPVQNPDENPKLFYSFFQHEWHKVDFGKSYMLRFNDGAFYLVYEIIDSGRDMTKYVGYRLYVQPTKDSDVTRIIINTSDLYRLRNAIEEKMSLSPEVCKYINDFLEA